MSPNDIPIAVTCPYCNEVAYRLQGKLAETAPGKTRFGCGNEHYFAYPESAGYVPIFVLKR